MTAVMASPSQEVRRVLLITLVLNLAVAFGKIILGIVTGALAITADGFHSLTDSAGNITGLIANLVADRPPDDNHPYGHRRFETLAAMAIGAMLLLTAWEMLKGVTDRLQNSSLPEVTPLALAVLVATLIINIFVSRYQIKEGERLKSEILLADAKNTSADVFVTLSVLFSTLMVAVTGWWWIDLVAALVVVALVGKAAWEIGQSTGRILVDTAPYEAGYLGSLLSDMPHPFTVARIRSRGSVDAVHIDVDLRVQPIMTTEQTNSIRYAIQQRLKTVIVGIVEIEVHFLPDHPEGRDTAMTARAYADAYGLSTHEVQVLEDTNGKVLEMHVEVPPQQTLGEAHQRVTALEEELVQALPEIARVLSHIEPVQLPETPIESAELQARARDLCDIAEKNLYQEYPDLAWHDCRVHPNHQGFMFSAHAVLPAQISVEAAHAVAESAEVYLRAEMPDLVRVTIHTEPDDDET